MHVLWLRLLLLLRNTAANGAAAAHSAHVVRFHFDVGRHGRRLNGVYL